MKKIILSLNDKIPEDSIDDFVNTALENGITDFKVENRHFYEQISSIEYVNIYSCDSTLHPQFLILNNPTEESIENELETSVHSNHLVGICHELASKEDEQNIISLAKKFPDIAFIIAELGNKEWKILPFENLIAELLSVDILLFASVESVEDSKLMTKLLEVGVDGIIFHPLQVDEIPKLNFLTRVTPTFDLIQAELVSIKPISKADRVCVDTTSILRENEGMLVGSTAKGFALIRAEVSDSIFTSSRPFRVNAGDVSAYIIVPSFDEKGDLSVRTKYLSEIKGGDDVIVVNLQGRMRIVTVGRAKIETRPMLLLNFQFLHGNEKDEFNVILQNAESVNLLKPDGNPISVTKIRRGDRILSYLGPSATHFGTPIKEMIIEK
ncbi:MAG: 3-dehydroquinate synthase II [Candidatus Lokiarchaeota archaeon]|nr:3-dehydroquinate synthase II [Candidatus Lokiarchaeota archaeon]